MRAEIRIERPGEIPARLTLTMTLDELREIREKLGTVPLYGPVGWLRDAINDLERKASAGFRFDEPSAPDSPRPAADGCP